MSLSKMIRSGMRGRWHRSGWVSVTGGISAANWHQRGSMIEDGRAGTSAPEWCTFSWSNPYLPGLVPALVHHPTVAPCIFLSAQSLRSKKNFPPRWEAGDAAPAGSPRFSGKISYLSDARSVTTRKPVFPEVESGVLELRAETR